VRRALVIVGMIAAVSGCSGLLGATLSSVTARAACHPDRDYASYNVEDSPCGMTWDNGMALDIEDCAYMGGEGWDD